MEVKYKITIKNDNESPISIFEVCDQIAKDVSWGTHSESLDAATKTVGHSNWLNYQPSYSVAGSNKIEKQGILYQKYDVTFHFKQEQFSFENEGLNHFIGTIAGNFIRNRNIEDIIVDDFEFTTDELDYFSGPKMTIKEMKSSFFSKTLKTPRPLLAFSIKPRIGLNPDDYEKIITEANQAGVDIVEDDERLVSPTYCTFSSRVERIKKLIDSKKAISKFSVNITGNPHDLKERINEAYSAGIRIFKLDVTVAGFDSLHFLRKTLNKKEENCLITVFPDVHGPVYRCLSRQFILKLSRLCGADIMYGGTPFPSRMGDLLKSSEDPQHWHSNSRNWIGELENMHQILKEPISPMFGSSKTNSTSKTIRTQTLPTITHDVDPNYVELLTYLIKMGMNGNLDYAFFVGGGISQFKCNKDIKSTIKLWLELLTYAGNYDLTGRTFKDLRNLTYFRSKNKELGRCLDDMGIKIFLSEELFPYKKIQN